MRYKPYKKRVKKFQLNKVQTAAVKSIVRRSLNKASETKYFSQTPYNSYWMTPAGAGYCENINIFKDIGQGVGEQQYTGRGYDALGIKVSLRIQNIIRTALGAGGTLKTPLFFTIALIESSKYGIGPTDFTLDGGPGDHKLGREGCLNDGLSTNFSKEKVKIKFFRRIVVKPLNTDHTATTYSVDQTVNMRTLDVYIPYHRKIQYESNQASNQQIKGDQTYLLVYSQSPDSASYLNVGVLTLNWTLYYKDF